MRQVIASLGALVIAGSLGVAVAAEPRTSEPVQGGQFFGGGDRQRPDSPACAELEELRRELARLQRELRHLQAAYAQARRAGNRERAAQIAQEIRRVEAAIDHVQHQIRRLLQECKGR